MKSDIEIAQSTELKHIREIAEIAHIPEEYLDYYGKYKAKIDLKILEKNKDKQGKLVLVTAINPTPAGEGKTTTTIGLADGLKKLNKNVIVALREPSLGPVLRQDPDIILLGEIRDTETAEIALQAGQTGHYVLSTIHTIDAIEVITRLRKMGISNYDISSTVGTTVSQRLVRKICKNCARKREFTEEEKNIINQIGKKYNVDFNLDGKFTYDAVGCKECNNSGYYERIGIFEVLNIEDNVKELIVNGASSIEIKDEALKGSYRPLVVDGINKVINGITTLNEVNKKLIIY